MGSKYVSQSPNGYNASPPPDDGTQSAANSITWLKIKSKLADVLNVWITNINAAILAALDVSMTGKAAAYTTAAGDHQKPIAVTGNTTISLGDAVTMGAGYQPTVVNTGGGTVTVGVITATDTLNGTVNGTLTLMVGQSVSFETNSAGYVIIGAYNGAAFSTTPATKAQQEAATSNSAMVTPANQQFHPSAAKGWCQAATTGSAAASYNVAGVTDTGVGDLNVNWIVAFSTGNYCAVPAIQSNTLLIPIVVDVSFQASFVRIQVYDTSGVLTDPNWTHVVAYGDQ